MSLLLEQFLATHHLRIVAIPDLEPSCLLRVIRRVLVLGYDVLEVEFSALLKESNSRTLDVIRIDNCVLSVILRNSIFELLHRLFVPGVQLQRSPRAV